ncbi:MAG: hypothetical protein V3575_05910 [Candidatus Absconditabacteria bacterium]
MLLEDLNHQEFNEKEFIDKINSSIFDGTLSDLIEVTYAYEDLGNGKFLNKTLFEKLIGEKYNNNISYLNGKAMFYLHNKKQLVNRFILELNSQSKLSEKMLILKGSLEYVRAILQLTIVGLPFESQKAGLENNYDEIKIQERVELLETIESKLFGGNIRNNKSESHDCYFYLKNIYQLNKGNLSQPEQTQFQGYLDILEKFISKDSIDTNNLSMKNTISQNIILKKLVNRDDYVRIFHLVFQIYGIQKSVIIDERSSIYDGDDAFYIPSAEAYEKLELQRVLQLIQHEIETHYIIQSNNEKLLGTFRGGNNLLREEGLAMVSEGLLAGKTLNDFGVSASLPMIFAGEVLDGEQYYDFINLLCKIKGENNINGIYLRRKRNYPLNYKGVQHKDATYSRGIQKVIEYIKDGKDLKELYIGKLSFEDLELGKKLSINNSINLKYPIFIGELIMFVLSGNKLQKLTFHKYLMNKYPFVFDKVSSQDLTLNELSFSNKKKIVEILKILGSK